MDQLIDNYTTALELEK